MSSGKKLTNEEAVERILAVCKKKNATFLGFDNKENRYVNNKTHLRLKCNICGYEWDTANFDKYTRSERSCPSCSNRMRFDEEDVLENIQKLCMKRDFTFIGFVGGKYENLYTKLRLKCNKCGETWESTTYSNFRKIDRCSHHCGRKNPVQTIKEKDYARVISELELILSSTSLEFVSFDDDGLNAKNKHVYLKCRKCGKIALYSLKHIKDEKTCHCKHCEANHKKSNEEAIKMVLDKCKNLDYTFLGFDNEENRYVNKRTYLILRCNKCGKIWNSTSFQCFVKGTIKCPGCVNSWKMEKEIEEALKARQIEYIDQCRNNTLPWLTYKQSLTFDFYIPSLNVAIECQGRQHFEPVVEFGGEDGFRKTRERDEKKLSLSKEHGVKLLYYDSECNNKTFLNERVYNDVEKLFNEIYAK